MEIVFIIVALVAGCGIGYLMLRYVATSQYKKRISDAEKEAEVIKEKKLLEVKEKFLSKKTELDKDMQQRNQKLLQTENRLKQREISLNQKQEDLARKRTRQPVAACGAVAERIAGGT